jgi:hypothetical protein
MQVYLKNTIDLLFNSKLNTQEELEKLIITGEIKQLENGIVYLIIKENE